jgi:ankyrin repeat protein
MPDDDAIHSTFYFKCYSAIETSQVTSAKLKAMIIKHLFVCLFLSFKQQPALSQSLEDKLFMSAIQNDVESVAKYMEEGANVNYQAPGSLQTPLMAAVLRGQTDVVEYLLSRRDVVDVSIPEKDGYTPAHGAAFQGRPEIMSLLIHAGINVKHDFHMDGYAPLHRACWGREQRHAETVKVLRDEAGADLTLPSRTSGATCREMTTNQHTLDLITESETVADKNEL